MTWHVGRDHGTCGGDGLFQAGWGGAMAREEGRGYGKRGGEGLWHVRKGEGIARVFLFFVFYLV